MVSNVQAQQRFQGSIVYSLHTPNEKNDAELLIQFGPNKIKVKFKEKEDYDKTSLLIDLDSGKFYTLNADSKTYQSKKLSENLPAPAATTKKIAGYNTSSVTISNSGFSGIFGTAGTTILFSAPDLYYPTPEKYIGIPELIMIQNNHVVLGAEIKMSYPGMGEELPDSVLKNMKATVEATKVSSQSIDVAEFSVPAGFTQQSRNYYPMMDSVDVSMDSVAVADTTPPLITTPRAKQEAKTEPKPSTPKKNVPTKSEAIKPKKTQSKT